jgi:hypothetical protein
MMKGTLLVVAMMLSFGSTAFCVAYLQRDYQDVISYSNTMRTTSREETIDREDISDIRLSIVASQRKRQRSLIRNFDKDARPLGEEDDEIPEENEGNDDDEFPQEEEDDDARLKDDDPEEDPLPDSSIATTAVPTLPPTLPAKETAKTVSFSSNFVCELECNLSRIFLARSSPCVCYTADDLRKPTQAPTPSTKTEIPTMDPSSSPTFKPTQVKNVVARIPTPAGDEPSASPTGTEPPTTTLQPTITAVPTVTPFPTVTGFPTQVPDDMNITISGGEEDDEDMEEDDLMMMMMDSRHRPLTETALTPLGPGAIFVQLDLREIPNITAAAVQQQGETEVVNVTQVDDGTEDEDIQLRRRLRRRLGQEQNHRTLVEQQQYQRLESRQRLMRLLLANPAPIGDVRIVSSTQPLNFVSTL